MTTAQPRTVGQEGELTVETLAEILASFVCNTCALTTAMASRNAPAICHAVEQLAQTRELVLVRFGLSEPRRRTGRD